MGVTWMKQGDAAKQLEEQAKQEAIARQEQMGKLWRFSLEKGETGEITFVDGLLDPKYNSLNPPRFYEHNLCINGKWGNFYVCPEKTDPQTGGKCPICAGGDKPGLVALFTVVDHNPYTTKKGVTIVNSRKLFVATPTVFESLNTIAQALKGNGLMGRRFSVTRANTATSARVGTTFTALDKEPLDELKTKYIRTFERMNAKKEKEKVTENAFTVADYEKEIDYKTADELAKLGFGPGGNGPSSTHAPHQSVAKENEVPEQNFEDQL